MDKTLRNERDLNWRLKKLTTIALKFESETKAVETDVNKHTNRMLQTIVQMKSYIEESEALHTELLEAKNARIAELEEKLAQSEFRKEPEPADPSLVKASTIAIFDSILFAIENWSTEGDTAPDFSLACQAVLFPLVYQQVMNGNEHYFLKKVPDASLEVVKRGREYVKFVRDTCQVGLTDPKAWETHVPMIEKWWVNDALPLLYGARDPMWERSSSLSLESIMSWRDQPASRALEFPLVFDAMDLLDRHREEIRETTNLPEFTRNTLDTRLEAN